MEAPRRRRAEKAADKNSMIKEERCMVEGGLTSTYSSNLIHSIHMKRFYILALLFSAGLYANAQPDRIDSLLSNILRNEKAVERILNPPSIYWFSGMSFSNKTEYAGIEVDKNLRSVSENTFLIHSSGLYIGESFSYYGNKNLSFNSTTVASGITRPLNKKQSLFINLAYSRFIIPDGDSLDINTLPNSVNISFSARSRSIGIRTSADLYFGKGFGLNFTPELFGDLKILRLGYSGSLYFEPSVAVLTGNMDMFPAGDSSEYTNSISKKFSLINTRITLPVNIYAGDFGMEISYSMNFPAIKTTETTSQSKGFLNLSVSWLIPVF